MLRKGGVVALTVLKLELSLCIQGLLVRPIIYSYCLSTLMVFAIHSKVFEAEWNQGENMPSKVVVDEILA